MATETLELGAQRSSTIETFLIRWAWAIAALVFLLVAFVWLALDTGVWDYDTTRHLLNTYAMREAVKGGDLLAPITQDNLNHYPPLLYVVGSIGMSLAGSNVQADGATIAQDLVFVPLLAAGCWGTARRAYGDLAGAVAAVIALGSPIVISLLHVYMLDVPEAACIAVAVWMLLESERFEHIGFAALAGVAGAGAILCKPTGVLFLVGFVAVALLRGGWRHPWGFLAFVAAGTALTLPWLLEHFSQLQELLQGAAGASVPGAGGASPEVTPARWSSKNFGWYGWALLNVQLLAPLFVAFVAGVVVATVRFVRTRSPADPTPELLVGGLVGWASMTYVTLKDPRYTLPALVYVAALSVAWLPALQPRWRRIATGAVLAVCAINLIGGSFGIGPTLRIAAPGAPPPEIGLAERSVRFYLPGAYIVGAPRDDSDVLALMRAVRAAGIDTLDFDQSNAGIEFNPQAVATLAGIAGLHGSTSLDVKRIPDDAVFLVRHPVERRGPRPCGRTRDGLGLFLIRDGDATVPFQRWSTWCPPGSPR